MLDDVALHRREQAQQLIGGALIDMAFPQDVAQGLDHPIELCLRDVLAGVDLFHGVAGVAAGSAAQFAYLLGEQPLDAVQLRVLEAGTRERLRHTRSMRVPAIAATPDSPPKWMYRPSSA